MFNDGNRGLAGFLHAVLHVVLREMADHLVLCPVDHFDMAHVVAVLNDSDDAEASLVERIHTQVDVVVDRLALIPLPPILAANVQACEH